MKLRLPLLLAVLALAFSAAPATAAPAPAWRVHSIALPTNFAPGSTGSDSYEVTIENAGGTSTNGDSLTLTDTLPAGLTVTSLRLPLPNASPSVAGFEKNAATFCGTIGTEVQTVTCTIPAELASRKPALLGPSEHLALVIQVAVPPNAAGVLTNFARVQGGGAPAGEATSQNPVSEAPAVSGFEAFQASLDDETGTSVFQAGAHPYQYSTYFSINTQPAPGGSHSTLVPAGGDVKDIEVELPPGLVGNPTAAARCTIQRFNASETIKAPAEGSSSYIVNECPNGSAVGLVAIQQLEGEGQVLSAALYNLVPPPGMPAQFGFRISGAYFYIDTSVRTGSDYGITATLRNVSEIKRITAAAVTIWGTPAANSHDEVRGNCAYPFAEYRPFNSLGSCPAGIAATPFLRLPTSCTTPMTQTMSFDTWVAPGSFVSEDSPTPPARNCASLAFSPSITSRPQVTSADSPSGLSFNLHIPQSDDPEVLATADLRDIAVTLPAGLSVNPSSASGLVGCTSAQVELHGPNPAACPQAAKVGAVEVRTPLLDHPLDGAVYVAAQGDNPFGSLLAIYVTAYDPVSGVVLKLPGRVELDEQTGQITTRFTENPQLPFEDLSVELFEGPRAPLRTPARCGAYSTSAVLNPWSAPESGPPATRSDAFSISSGPGGGPCPSGAPAISLAAGVQTPIAGSYTPFVMRLSREDGSAEISAVELATPKGLLARLAGIPYCSAAAITQAQGRLHLRGGAEELASPSCPAASRVGAITVGAGAGPTPFYAGGQAYLAGPYKGAPLSLVAIVPAVAGPFDLGVVTNRIALHIDPQSAQVTAVSDPFPTILSGIPLDTRDIRIALDRPEFIRAPTSCAPTSVRGVASGPSGSAAASDRFQVGGCKGLDFKPKLSLALDGGTKRNQHPALKSVITYPKGEYANIAKAAVTLPASEFIDQAHIGNPCVRPDFAAEKCPKLSILGRAKAWSPLLDKPLEGKVYFRSNGGERALPDIVLDLKGQIHVVVVGFVDAAHKKGSEVSRLRTTFAQVPDAPVSRFVLELKGGKEGLLVNSGNLCKVPNRALVKLTAQSGKTYDTEPAVANNCGKKAR
jgi:uncharacterized repeat protein (TIGR01451 family)